MMQGIQSVNAAIPIFGGGAGDNGALKEQFVFTSKGITGLGTAAVVFDSNDLIIHTDYHLNWVPIGKEFIVTEAEGKHLKKIAGYTPYQLYSHYLGKTVADRLPQSAVDIPLIIHKNGVQIARVIGQMNPDGTAIMVGNVERGDVAQFAYGHVDQIIGKTTQLIDKIKQLPTEAIFIYSCVARLAFLQEAIQNETEPLHQIAPTAVFLHTENFIIKTANANF